MAILFLSAIQSISGACLVLIHAYRQARDTVKKVNENTPRAPGSQQPFTPISRSLTPEVILPSPGPSPNPLAIPGSLTSASAPPKVISHPPTPPSRGPPTPTSISSIDPLLRTTSTSTVQTASNSTSSAPAVLAAPPPGPPSPPNYTASALLLIQTLLPPNLTARGLTQVLALPITALDPFLSRLLPYLLYNHVLSPEQIAGVVRSARRALFPEGWPGPPPPDPTVEEQAALRTTLGRRLLTATPG